MSARQAACSAASASTAMRRPLVPSALARVRPTFGTSSSSRAPTSAAFVTCQRRDFASGFHYNFTSGFPGGGPPPSGDRDKFYRLLEIPREADEAQIKQAYKKQAMKHHPDKGGDENLFKEISKAYEVLSNPQKRQVYDMYGEEGLDGAQGAGGGPEVNPFDLFSSIFGFNLGRQQQGPPRTADSVYDLQLSLEDLYQGTSRTIKFHREALCRSCDGQGGKDRKTCKQCDGQGVTVQLQNLGPFIQQVRSACRACSGRGYTIPSASLCGTCKGKATVKESKTFTVDIEPGLNDGVEFRYRGQADEAPGKEAGDVIIKVRQKPHRLFQRKGETLVMSKKVKLADALCGFEFTVPYLNGEDLTIRSNPGQVINPRDILILAGKGMPRPRGQRPGDLFLMVEVEFPTSLPPGSREQLAKLLGSTPLPEEPSPSATEARKVTSRQAEELRTRISSSDEGPGCQQQ